VVGYQLYSVVRVLCWNHVIVSLAVLGTTGTSVYVNTYWYYLGREHWMGFVYAVLVGYRCYCTKQLINVGGLVLGFVSCWIIAELKRAR